MSQGLTENIIKKSAAKGQAGIDRIISVCGSADEVNRELLFSLLKENENTEYGRKYGFKNIKTFEDYKNKVPLTTYDDYAEYVEKIEKGNKNILSSRNTEHFALSSGSAGEPKRVPMCAEAAELFSTYTHGACFAVMSRELGENWIKARGVSFTEIRFKTKENGFTYGAVSGKVREKNKQYENLLYTSPLSVSYPKCSMDFRYMHLRFALLERDLSFITSTFITAVYDAVKYLEANWPDIVEDIKLGRIGGGSGAPAYLIEELESSLYPAPERAAELEAEFEKGFDGILTRIWPNMAFIFGIGSESFKVYTEKLRKYIGKAKIHYSVYSSSEGIFAFPIKSECEDMVMIPFSAFYEFRDISNENSFDTVTFSGLEKGKRYEIIITNISGFYRYRIMDVIEVVDFIGQLPVIRFVYRLNQVLNMAGEKTNDSMMKYVMSDFEFETGEEIIEYTVCADTDISPGRYLIFAEYGRPVSQNDIRRFQKVIEEKLCFYNHSYADKIKTGKLGRLKIIPLKKGAYKAYVDMMSKKEVSVNQLKPIRVVSGGEKKCFFVKWSDNGVDLKLRR